MIPSEELSRLAALYDRFANHLDPLSAGWKRSRQEYLDALADLHERYGSGVSFEEFRREAQRACFLWLRAQDRPTSPPPKARCMRRWDIYQPEVDRVFSVAKILNTPFPAANTRPQPD